MSVAPVVQGMSKEGLSRETVPVTFPQGLRPATSVARLLTGLTVQGPETQAGRARAGSSQWTPWPEGPERVA